MSEQDIIARFDAYLSGEMSEAKKAQFEKDMRSDTDLKSAFEAYQKFAHQIEEGSQYGDVKDQLDTIHSEVYGDNNSKRVIFLQPKVLIPLGIAASIALIVMIVNPFNNRETAMGDSEPDYVELENTDEEVSEEGEAEETEYDSVTETEHVFLDSIEHIDKLNEILPVMKTPPKGTCFLISTNGYFVTSKHLVRKTRYVQVQQKDRDVAFNAEVVYRDTLLDLAILKSDPSQTSHFKAVPFRFNTKEINLGDEVFALGYPKADIVYTQGVVSSETGYQSDSMSYEISMPSNGGNSGAPLYNDAGYLIGMVIANNSKKQSVTYILEAAYIKKRIRQLQGSMDIDISKNYRRRFKNRGDMIKRFRPYIFEIH